MPLFYRVLASLVLVMLIARPGHAQAAATIFEIDKLLAGVPQVVEQGATVPLRDGTGTTLVRVDSLRAVWEVHRRLGEVSKVQATVALVVDPLVNAVAIPLPRSNLILITTGILEMVGTDTGMIAAVLGHEYAHHYMKHSFERVMKMPEFVYGATAVGRSTAKETGSPHLATRAATTAFGLMQASFSRKQEAEADKVGTELMSDGRYDPAGITRLINALLQRYGGQPTGYFDSHPGLQERLAKAAPTVLNQRYDGQAEELKDQRKWKELGQLVDQWLKSNPDSARAWYFKGAVLKATKRPGALAAFEKAALYDPNLQPARLALCIELYAAGRERDSLVCAEYLHRNEMFDEYVAKTFKHPVHVGGIHPAPVVTEQDLSIVQQAMQQRQKAGEKDSKGSKDIKDKK